MNKINGDNFEKHVLQIKQQNFPQSRIYLWKNVPWNLMLESTLINDMEIHRKERKHILEQKRQGITNDNELKCNIMDRGIDILEKTEEKSEKVADKTWRENLKVGD